MNVEVMYTSREADWCGINLASEKHTTWINHSPEILLVNEDILQHGEEKSKDIGNCLIRLLLQNGQGHFHSMEEQSTITRGAERVLPAALL